MGEDVGAALDDLVDSFMRGDQTRLAARYHDDIDWLFYAPVVVFPFAGHRRGKVEVFKGYALMHQVFQMSKYVLETRIVEGHRAATVSQSTLVQRATGRIISSRVASFFQFREGQVIEYRGFTDSFDGVEQALGRELDVGS
jgi:ketosteroid isomerase-like protein